MARSRRRFTESCVFTDPTLSFKGLRTFEKNIESVEGVLDKFLGANLCVLYGLEKGKDGSVKTRWRMVGDIKLPWRPRLDLLDEPYSLQAERRAYSVLF